MIRRLLEDDAQSFIDVMDEARCYHESCWLELTFPYLSLRHWPPPTFHQVPEKNVSSRCTGRVVVAHFSRNP